MEVLSTGLVIVGAYDDKVRRALFGTVKGVDPKELARAAGELNSFLFRLLVEELGLDKGDVVRVRVPFDVVDGRVVWDLRGMDVEVFRRVDERAVRGSLERLLSSYKVEERVVKYEFKPKVETLDGRTIYDILLDGKVVGAAAFDGEVLEGAVLEPVPKVFKGRPKPDFEDVILEGESVERRKAGKVLEGLRV